MEKKLKELPKNAGLHFLLPWKCKNLVTVENMLSYYENQINLVVKM